MPSPSREQLKLPMKYSFKDVKNRLGRKVAFKCVSRRAKKTARDFKLQHVLGMPASVSDIPEWMSPSFKKLYRSHNGCVLFSPSKASEDGFVLFDMKQIAQETVDLREFLNQQKGSRSSSGDTEDIQDWQAGLIPIAAPMLSGDRYVLDTHNRQADGEYPILFLDHEQYYSGSCAPEDADQVASSYIEFICNVLDDPLKYLASTWTGGRKDEQWFPRSVEFERSELAAKMEAKDVSIGLELTIEQIRKLSINVKGVALSEFSVAPEKQAKSNCMTVLHAPLLGNKLSVVRFIPPAGASFCDISVFDSYSLSIMRFAETFSEAEKKNIRFEQKKAGWGSHDIYRDGPSFANSRQHIDLCVQTRDLDEPINYIRQQLASFPVPLMSNDHWQIDWTQIDDGSVEYELSKLVGSFGEKSQKAQRLAAVCKALESGRTTPLATCLRGRLTFQSIFSLGPDRETGMIKDYHVWRARLARLLCWPDLVLGARMCLAHQADGQVIDDEGNVIDWRHELQMFESEMLLRFPVIDHKYQPSE